MVKLVYPLRRQLIRPERPERPSRPERPVRSDRGGDRGGDSRGGYSQRPRQGKGDLMINTSLLKKILNLKWLAS